MSRNKLIVTVGLPRSGKTTWARAYAKEYGVPIVCPDAVRLAIHGQRFIAAAEGFVWATVHAMVPALFLAGHDAVILDATNITRERRDRWQSEKWDTFFHVISTTREECLARAAAQGDSDIVPVIERMSYSMEPLWKDEKVFTPPVDTLPKGSLLLSDREREILQYFVDAWQDANFRPYGMVTYQAVLDLLQKLGVSAPKFEVFLARLEDFRSSGLSHQITDSDANQGSR